MIQFPIHRALLMVKNSRARFLLMGGQACVLYGAAEFSRDLDLAISIVPTDVEALKRALAELKSEQAYVPGFEVDALARGHACHFRCRAPGLENLRIDLMSRFRGCPDFEVLWERRSLVELPEIGSLGVMSLPDLIQAKKTQRDKDWPMIRRLIEVDYLRSRNDPTPAQVRLWLRECRTPSLLVRLATRFADECKLAATERDALRAVLQGDLAAIDSCLEAEEKKEREADRLYWAPLRAELTRWRRASTRRQEQGPE